MMKRFAISFLFVSFSILLVSSCSWLMEPQEREKLDIRRLPPEHGRFDAILIAGHFYRWEKQLPVLRELLAPGGKLYVADANRIGLKYLAGCQEEYCGGYFTGIDGYPDAAAVGRSGRSYSPRFHRMR